MVYRRTHQVVKRLAARRSAILAAARDTAAEGGMSAVQIAPVAVRANVAAGTVYRYFPSKAELISELIAEVSRDELAAIRRAADAAPGPSSALAAAVTTVAVHVLSRRLASLEADTSTSTGSAKMPQASLRCDSTCTATVVTAAASAEEGPGAASAARRIAASSSRDTSAISSEISSALEGK